MANVVWEKSVTVRIGKQEYRGKLIRIGDIAALSWPEVHYLLELEGKAPRGIATTIYVYQHPFEKDPIRPGIGEWYAMDRKEDRFVLVECLYKIDRSLPIKCKRKQMTVTLEN